MASGVFKVPEQERLVTDLVARVNRLEGALLGDRIYLTAQDFHYIDSHIDSADKGKTTTAHTYITATVRIPAGYQATGCIVYGDSEVDAVEVFECWIDNNKATSKGARKVESGQASTDNFFKITPVKSTTRNYLLIYVSGLATIEIYGGYVEIKEVR